MNSGRFPEGLPHTFTDRWDVIFEGEESLIVNILVNRSDVAYQL